MKQVFTITVKKSPNLQDSWGFEVVGGLDYGSPIIVKKVDPNSLAQKMGLQKKDVIESFNKIHGKDKKLNEIKMLMNNADELVLVVERIIRQEKEGKFVKRRYQIALLAFLGFCNVYAMRVNLSVAIVAMTTNQTILTSNGTYETVLPEFNWSLGTRGIILSSFFYGYGATQLLGGWFATHFGGKIIFGLGVFVTAIFTAITPWLARTHVSLLVGARIIEGLFEGVTYPAMHAFWGSWAPPLERSKLTTIALTGGSFGTVISLPLSGLIADYLGWPYIFYTFGVLGSLWSALWWFTVGNYPSDDKFMSESEKTFIQTSIGNKKFEKMNIPWKQILTSVPVWAIIIAHFCENWGFYTLLTELPTYMDEIFHFEMGSTGIICALPYLLMSIMVPLGGSIADYLRQNAILTTTQVRRILNCSAFLFQGIFLLVFAHASSMVFVISSLTLALGLGGLSLSGFSVNPLDIGHQYAGIIYGISNTLAATPGVMSPTLTGYLRQVQGKYGWTLVFYLSVLIYFFGAVAYWFMASGELQPWAKQKPEEHLLKGKNENSDTKPCDVNDILNV